MMQQHDPELINTIAPRPVSDRVGTASSGGTSRSAHVSMKDLVLRFEVDGAQPIVALNGLSLDLADGEFVAVIGPSGCGKSTLLNLVAGLYHPDEGSVSLRDKPVTQISTNVGYVTQSDTLLPWMTVLSNVALPLRLRRRGTRAERRQQAHKWLQRVHLPDFAHVYPWQISGGMRSRAMLARTLIYEPEVLLMDEPFGKLDALMRLRMQDLLLELWMAHQTTVLYITHDIDEALRLADRVIVMSRRPGRVLAEYTIQAPRPRDTRNDAELVDLHEKIWGILRVEIGAQEAEEDAALEHPGEPAANGDASPNDEIAHDGTSTRPSSSDRLAP